MSAEQVRWARTDAPEIQRLDDEPNPRYEFVYPVVIEKSALSDEDIVLGGPNDRPPRRQFERIGAVRVGMSLESLNRDLAQSQGRVFAMTLVIAVVSLSFTALFLRRIISPITTLAEGTRRISAGDFSFRARTDARDEIGLLASAFNEMSERIESFQQGLERKVAERTEALAAKTRDMEEFVYTVSHDLKAPVVSTHGLISLLAEEFGSDLPEDAHLYIDRIKHNASHMERLIQDLMEVSRVDRTDRPKETVDVGDIVQGILLEHDAQIREGNITVDVAADLPHAWGEADQLLQVFDNLIANAIKFRNPNGAGLIRIQGRDEPHRSVFQVIDDGIGIDPRHHDKVFGLFQRLHSEREYPGTGLGLAIVKKDRREAQRGDRGLVGARTRLHLHGDAPPKRSAIPSPRRSLVKWWIRAP